MGHPQREGAAIPVEYKHGRTFSKRSAPAERLEKAGEKILPLPITIGVVMRYRKGIPHPTTGARQSNEGALRCHIITRMEGATLVIGEGAKGQTPSPSALLAQNAWRKRGAIAPALML